MQTPYTPFQKRFCLVLFRIQERNVSTFTFKVDHISTYGEVHDAFGRRRGRGKIAIKRKPQKYNIISGEYTNIAQFSRSKFVGRATKREARGSNFPRASRLYRPLTNSSRSGGPHTVTQQ